MIQSSVAGAGEPPLAMIEWDRQLRVTLWNGAAESLFGYAAGEAVGKHLSFICTAVGRRHVEEIRQALSAGGGGRATVENVRRDGCVIACEWHNALLVDGAGAVTGVASLVEDLSRHGMAVDALRKSEQKFHALFEQTSHLIGLMDLDGTLTDVNSTALRFSGLEKADVIGRLFWDTPWWSHAPELQERLRQAVRAAVGGEHVGFEATHPAADGGIRHVDFSIRPVMDDTGTVLFLVPEGRDITDRKNTERALNDSEEKYRRLFEESQDIVFIATRAGSFIDINPAGIARFGYPSREAFSQVLFRDCFVHPEELTRFLGVLDENGFVAECETTLLRRDGQQMHAAISATAIFDDRGGISSFRGIIRDLSEKHRLEAQLRQAQKMESIGTLAGGVAHDFNNILSAISGYGELALLRMAPSDPNRRYLENILEATGRAATLTSDLLLFGRKRRVERHVVDLNAVIRKIGKFLDRVIGDSVTSRVALCSGEVTVLADSHQIDQILLNFATNARDAMPGGGSFSITTEKVVLTGEFVAAHGFGKPGRYALVAVSDTGTGMDESVVQRIFDPFFTTKDVGKGTGLGLAVVYSIVKQHDGLVTVYSEPGRGTIFRVYLPIVESASGPDPVTADEDPLVEERLARGTETILLAEDNAAVRDMTLTMLQEAGYTVVTAVDGADAVKKFEENRDRIRLLLFDLVMPGLSGKEAADEIRRLRPGIGVVFASGYDPDLVRQSALVEEHVPVLSKPVARATLLKAVRGVLDR